MIDASLKNANILIVDDNQANIDVLTSLLDAKGFTNYTTTTDSRKVIGLFEEFNPDLLLLDLSMPYLTGFQVMMQLKILVPAKTYFPILILTADITPESKQKALADGASDFLTKPFDLLEVDLRIKNLLKARYLHQQSENQNRILEERVKERTIELEKTNAELIEAKEKAEQMNKLKSIFLANMSHELRTPLISVLGFAELLQLELTDAEQLKLIDQVLEGGRRLNLTLNSILEWSKLKSEKLSLKLSAYNMAEEIQKNITLYLQMAKAKQLFVRSEFNDTNLVVIMDAELFDEALFQLIHNAIKFTAKGGVLVTLNHVKKGEVVWAVIQVKDTGIGIPKENLDKIFVEFRQSSEGLNRSYEGSGLGLSIAKKMIELMKGKIEIESEVGEGSTFSIWLPAVLDEKTLNLKVEEKRKTIVVEPAIGRTTVIPAILIVEDNPSNRLLINKMLAKDFLIQEAEDGITGIALASQKLFSLVLIDISLDSGIGGTETMHEIRKIPGYYKVPVVAVTAYAMFGDAERLLKEGFDDYVKRPFSKEEITSHVKKLLTKYK
jgi:signal transduction histidine kinase